jgi:nucleoside-specific channel-forming protein
MIMKKTLLAAGAVLALSSSFTVNAAENDKPQYLSDWWHQSVNVVGSYHTRFGPRSVTIPTWNTKRSPRKTGLISTATWMLPVFFGGNTDERYLEPRFSAVYGNRTTLLYR